MSSSRSRTRRRGRRAAPASTQAILVMLLLGTLAMVGLYSLAAELVSERTILRGADVDIDGRPRLEIRNGCGAAGLAQEARRRLVDRGFDVVHTGNADDFRHLRSVFIDLKDDLPRARALAAAIGCPNAIQQIEPGNLADFALVLGADHQELKWQN